MTKKEIVSSCNMEEVGDPALTATRRCNKDDLRTHMANERTFLSWCRTSISLVIFGFVLGRFEILLQMGKENGLHTGNTHTMTDLRLVALFCFLLAGVLILISGWRFLYVRKKIMRGEMSISIFPELMVIISMIFIIAMVIVLMVGI